MGQAQVYCYESEKTGKMELEKLHFLTDICLLLPELQENPSFRSLKAGVLWQSEDFAGKVLYVIPLPYNKKFY